MDDVKCVGTEASLFDCPYNPTDNCGASEGAGVVCKNITTNNTIELRGGLTPEEGNIFLYNKPVCDDGWDLRDADVACRMLGYIEFER